MKKIILVLFMVVMTSYGYPRPRAQSQRLLKEKGPEGYAFKTKHIQIQKEKFIQGGQGGGQGGFNFGEEFGEQNEEIDQEQHLDEPHHYPKYEFAYGVKDPKTGDIKDAWEIRDGDKVEGEYRLVEPDGTERIVKYHASDKEGFHAIVKTIGKPKEEIIQGNRLEKNAGLQEHHIKKAPAVSYQKVSQKSQ